MLTIFLKDANIWRTFCNVKEFFMSMVANPNRFLAFLTNAGIKFTETPFGEAVFTCKRVAEITGLAEGAIGKAMVVGVDKARVIALLPGPNRLDINKVKALLGAKKAFLLKPNEVTEATGLEVGAVTPLLKFERADIRLVMDSELLKPAEINISSGELNVGVTLNPNVLADSLGATIGDISMPLPV